MKIDHVFVCCSAGAPEGDALVRCGVAEGSGNVHPGQGTANRRFFFANAYLELLWVHDATQARSPATEATRLWERWRERGAGACPFGVLLRPSAADEPPPFATWSYRPAYLPAGMAIEFARDVPLDEPELAILPFARPVASPPDGTTSHAGTPFGPLIGVRVGLPRSAHLSAASLGLPALVPLAYFNAAAYLLELVFDGAQGIVHDLRPALPLLLRGA